MMLSRVCLDSGAVARAPRRPRVVMAKHAKSAVRLRKATHSPSHVARGDPTPPDDRPPALVPALAALVVAATALGNLPLVAPRVYLTAAGNALPYNCETCCKRKDTTESRVWFSSLSQ